MAANQIGHYSLSWASKADTPMARGNQRADQVAKEAAEQMAVLVLTLPDPGRSNLQEDPAYIPSDLQHLPRTWQSQQPVNWWMTGNGRLILPGKLAETLLCQVHRSTHLGTRKPEDLIRQSH